MTTTEAMLARTAPGRAASAASRRQRVLARTSKTCSRCNQDQPVTEFRPAGRDGPESYSWCRQCQARAADERRERRRAEAARDREAEAELPEGLRAPLCAGCGKRRPPSAYSNRQYNRRTTRCEACRAMVSTNPVIHAARKKIAARLDAQAAALTEARELYLDELAAKAADTPALPLLPAFRAVTGPECPGCTPDLDNNGHVVHQRSCPVTRAGTARDFRAGWRKCGDCGQQLPPSAFRPGAGTCDSCRELARDELVRAVAPPVSIPRTAAPVLPAMGARSQKRPHQPHTDGVFA
jgi:hypothetical protein